MLWKFLSTKGGVYVSKSDVLKALLSRPSVSGSALSKALGISRAAVWKSVEALREDGYIISSKTNSGYSLHQAPDILSPELIAAHLSGPAWNILSFDRLDSTNSHAKRLDEAASATGGLPDLSVVLCDEQTGGKGRLGRSFVSAKGLGLYLSAVFKPVVPAAELSFATAVTAVAVRRAISRAAGLSPDIKWTNDLVVGGKKLCGILTELSVEGESGSVQHMIIGIGINVAYAADDFPPDISEFCTSLSLQHASVNRAALAAAILDELSLMYSEGRFICDLAEYREEYRKHCITIGRDVSVVRGADVRRGKAVGLDDQFGLLIDYGDGTPVSVQSGEVSVRGLYGYI